jgi:aerobic-type carbon monoxide dehydrogenase small subunit (CoxS/CutS family)
MPFTLLVNGTEHHVDSPPEQKLLYVLRDEIGLTGTKYGCGEGQCAACTVLLDGEPVRSCRTPVRAAARKKITTIEGLEKDGELHPVQRGFLEAEAFQCGYCTPGMILSAVALLREHPSSTPTQVIEQMDGNICRCGTYPRIVEAIQRAAILSRKSS